MLVTVNDESSFLLDCLVLNIFSRAPGYKIKVGENRENNKRNLNKNIEHFHD